MRTKGNQSILVAGATGGLGGDICCQLVARGHRVRALVRASSDEARREFLKDLDVHLLEGDLKERTSLEAACNGVTSVITTVATPTPGQPGDSIQTTDIEGHQRLIETAREAGVEHIVFTSVSGTIPTHGTFLEGKREVEEQVKQSGMRYTILRPTYFMETWLGPEVGFDIANGRAQVFGSGEGKINWIALGDVARFAVEALVRPTAWNATLELGGPDWLSPVEVICLCEKLSGRVFAVQQVPREELERQLRTATDDFQQTFAVLVSFLLRGQSQSIDMRATLRAIPVPLTSVRTYAQSKLSL
jgi:uncharacterized protein YbjT (DUF2867 family)